MKTILIAFLTTCCLSVSAQVSPHPFDTIPWVRGITTPSPLWEIIVWDSARTQPVITKPYIQVDGDTLEAISGLLKKMVQSIELLDAAEEILLYINTDGRIINRSKFDKAVKRYRELKEIKTP